MRGEVRLSCEVLNGIMKSVAEVRWPVLEFLERWSLEVLLSSAPMRSLHVELYEPIVGLTSPHPELLAPLEQSPKTGLSWSRPPSSRLARSTSLHRSHP